jgi:hypothetical protein
MLKISYYTYYEFDSYTWVVEYEGAEFCVCSTFEEETETAENRAKKICDTLNSELKSRFVVLDESFDYGGGVYGVILDKNSDEDFQGISTFEELDRAVILKDELNLSDKAGSWNVFAIVPVREEISLKLMEENDNEESV